MKNLKELIKNELIKQYECALSYPNPDCEPSYLDLNMDLLKIDKIYNDIINKVNNKNEDEIFEIVWDSINNNN